MIFIGSVGRGKHIELEFLPDHRRDCETPLGSGIQPRDPGPQHILQGGGQRNPDRGDGHRIVGPLATMAPVDEGIGLA